MIDLLNDMSRQIDSLCFNSIEWEITSCVFVYVVAVVVAVTTMYWGQSHKSGMESVFSANNLRFRYLGIWTDFQHA